ncbi:hypothetical protein MRX96_025754 [Rhipicephalus microplus]
MGSCNGFIVYPKLLESRKEDGGLVLQVHPDLTLKLEKSNILAKNILFQSATLEETGTFLLDGRELGKNLYHSSEHKSSLVILRSESGIQVQGILDLDQRIAPVKKRFQASDKNIPHQIFKIQKRTVSASGRDDSEDEEGKDDAYAEAVALENANVNHSIPATFVVETCIIASANYTSYFNTSEDLTLYLGAMLNSAGIVFSDMRNPSISLQLNAVLNISDERLFGNPVCGMANNPFTHKLNSTVCGFDAEETLNRTTDYANLCLKAECDIIYHITKEELTFTQNATFNTDITGYAKIRGACTRLKYGIGEDKPHTYSGLVTLIHEIGHLLGAYHDGSPEAVDCPAAYGNLMSTLHRGVQNKSKLSPCTEEAIRAYVRNLTTECTNISAISSYTNKTLPGQNMSHEAYCALLFPGGELSKEDLSQEHDECEIQCCWNNTDILESRSDSATAKEDYGGTEESPSETYDYNMGSTCRFVDMLDGMSCEGNKTCKAGFCGEHVWEPTRK